MKNIFKDLELILASKNKKIILSRNLVARERQFRIQEDFFNVIKPVKLESDSEKNFSLTIGKEDNSFCCKLLFKAYIVSKVKNIDTFPKAVKGIIKKVQKISSEEYYQEISIDEQTMKNILNEANEKLIKLRNNYDNVVKFLKTVEVPEDYITSEPIEIPKEYLTI